jgi:hypothetical protein
LQQPLARGEVGWNAYTALLVINSHYRDVYATALPPAGHDRGKVSSTGPDI